MRHPAAIAVVIIVSLTVTAPPLFAPANIQIGMQDFYSTPPVGAVLGLKDLANQQLAPGQGTQCTMDVGRVGSSFNVNYTTQCLHQAGWPKDRKLALCSLGDGMWLCTTFGDDGEPGGDLLFDRGYLAAAQAMGVKLEVKSLPAKVGGVTGPDGKLAGFIMVIDQKFKPASLTLAGTVENPTLFNKLGFSASKGDAVELTRTGYLTWKTQCKGDNPQTLTVQPESFFADARRCRAAGIVPAPDMEIPSEQLDREQLMTMINRARALALCGLRPMPLLGPSGAGKSTLISPCRHLLAFDRGYIMELDVVDPAWLNHRGGSFKKGQKLTLKHLGDNTWEIRSKDGKLLKVNVPRKYTKC